MKSYCAQNSDRCWNCSLVKYGRDCRNQPASWWLTADAAKAWGLSPVRVRELLQAGRVPGAEQEIVNGHCVWCIPEGAPRPKQLKPGPKPNDIVRRT
jgi:hypothetical protein